MPTSRRTNRPIKSAKLILQRLEDPRSKTRILDHYELGGLILVECPPGARREDGQMIRIAKALGVPRQRAYRLREFANLYTPAEAKKLSRLLPTITLSHIAILCSIADRRVRAGFQRQLANHSWTANELHLAVRDRLGRRRSGGRPVKPRPADDTLRALQYRFDALQRLWDEHGSKVLLDVTLADGLAQLAASMIKLGKAMRKL